MTPWRLGPTRFCGPIAALTEATIIVEAEETSGTLVQAREALKQKRKVFILNSNLNEKV
jgi:predicted Rossmann fold nucleotide-binding protein DprA/Smf involved in DNA uptake